MARFPRLVSAVALLALAALLAPVAAPADSGALAVRLEGLTPGGFLPLSTAFCLPPGSPGKPHDQSPGLDWSTGPAGTQSYVVISIDPDVTADLSLMNKPGVRIPVGAPRQNIYHWELINIPAWVTRLAPGVEGDGFVPGGKPIGATILGVRGTNDYWPLFNKNPHAPPGMKGPYGGFDGPCVPSNDDLVHTYKFQVFALDVRTLPLTGQFFAPAVYKAMQGHVLAQGEAAAKFVYDPK
jgi:Raf kinase inhibitor-like YbhB/YbcL family protein